MRNHNDVLCLCTAACDHDSFVFKHLVLLRSIYEPTEDKGTHKLLFPEKPYTIPVNVELSRLAARPYVGWYMLMGRGI